MYIPPSFRVDDTQTIHQFIKQNPFATLITNGPDGLFASHAPLLLRFEEDRAFLIGHLARANKQWQHFEGGEVLAIFHGPHAYISPSWYANKVAVPTWNYAAVHVYGRATLITDASELEKLLDEMVEHFEAGIKNPSQSELSREMKENLMKAIVGFRIEITRLEGKWKLGQNRSEADIHSVFQALAQGNADEQKVAHLMVEENLISAADK